MHELDQLLDLMQRLRDPEHGCPWDREQTFATIAPYTIEEAYEVEDAIARNDLDALNDELGDLLFQVVFHSQLAQEMAAFDFADVAANIRAKMIRRHPHVFGPRPLLNDEQQNEQWESIKASERQAKQCASSALDGVAVALPALSRALKLQKRAARVGFDWPEIEPVFDKVQEELGEIVDAIDNRPDHIEQEIGDLLFSCVNLARHLQVDPETALRTSSRKFEHRFRAIEQSLAKQNRTVEHTSLSELDNLWEQVKINEQPAHGAPDPDEKKAP